MAQQNTGAYFHRTTRRDHRCLWFSHLPGPISSRLAMLAQDEPITLLIRRIGDSSRVDTTRWVRMRSGSDGRPTQGVRVVDGIPVFESIPLKTDFEIALAAAESGTPRGAAAAKSDSPAVSTKLIPNRPPDREGQLFQAYIVADYSGAEDVNVQRRAIKVAVGEGGQISLLPQGVTRSSLVRVLADKLLSYTRQGIRAIVGMDHQYGIPIALARELGLAGLPWRELITQLYAGGYGPDGLGPKWEHPLRFAAAFNNFLRQQGLPDYFWSATKQEFYGLRHSTNPRSAIDLTQSFRITELCRGMGTSAAPKPLSRLGDNGSVGNQSCCGMGHLLELIQTCEQQHVPVAVWPMDGLDIRSEAYAGRHVFVEPYPSAKRDRTIAQTDANDAIESVRFLQERDQSGQLRAVCDLSTLTPHEAAIVRIEGWIVSHLPWNRVPQGKRA